MASVRLWHLGPLARNLIHLCALSFVMKYGCLSTKMVHNLSGQFYCLNEKGVLLTQKSAMFRKRKCLHTNFVETFKKCNAELFPTLQLFVYWLILSAQRFQDFSRSDIFCSGNIATCEACLEKIFVTTSANSPRKVTCTSAVSGGPGTHANYEDPDPATKAVVFYNNYRPRQLS